MQILSIYLAALVVYRFFFGALHILKCKCMFNCYGERYQMKEVNLHAAYKKARRKSDSSLASYKLIKEMEK